MTNKPINKTFLIILLGILAALGPFTIDMYLPGFKRIAEDFGTDEKQVAFTLTLLCRNCSRTVNLRTDR